MTAWTHVDMWEHCHIRNIVSFVTSMHQILINARIVGCFKNRCVLFLLKQAFKLQRAISHMGKIFKQLLFDYRTLTFLLPVHILYHHVFKVTIIWNFGIFRCCSSCFDLFFQCQNILSVLRKRKAFGGEGRKKSNQLSIYTR